MTLMMTSALDPAQRKAATGSARYQLVLAGPGSGKTTTLAGRFVHLVQNGADPGRILALTFTKKAADEMKARITVALGLPSARGANIATFHGFTFRHLRRNPQIAGLSEDFQLWDTPDQRHIFSSRQMWWYEEVDILEIITGAKERLLDATSFAATIDKSDEVVALARWSSSGSTRAPSSKRAPSTLPIWCRLWLERWTAIPVMRRRLRAPSITSWSTNIRTSTPRRSN